MRIVHVMDHSLPRADGYAIRAKYLLEAQAARGHQVTVLTSPSQGEDAVEETIGGVRYCRSRYSGSERRIAARGGKHIVFGRAIARELDRLIDRGGFDIIHAHTPFTVARVGLQEACKRSLPFVYEKRNLWEESARARGKLSGRWPFYSLARAIDRQVTLRADAVCTITQALRLQTLKIGAREDRVIVVGNGVDTTAFAPRRAPAELRARCASGGRFVVGFVGSFFSFEGLPLLVDAINLLRGRHPDVRLVLVGEGEDFQRIARQVSRNELQRHVWLAGRVPHSEVLDFYAAMDVLVYPRYPSTLVEMISPLKPLEPMAMARCVVGSDVGGIRELIRHEDTGLLFRAGSLTALADTLDGLLSNRFDAAALGNRARAHVMAHRQWRHMAEAYEAAYQRARTRLS